MDILLLNALTSRKQYNANRGAVKDDLYDATTIRLLDYFGKYLEAFKERDVIERDELLSWLRTKVADVEAMNNVEATVKEAFKPQPKEAIDNILINLTENRVAGEVAAVVTAYQRGEEIDIVQEVQHITQAANKELRVTGDTPWEQRDIVDLINAERDDSGLPWDDFPLLNESVKGMKAGLNMCVAADTDAGKTSLMLKLVAMWQRHAKNHSEYGDRPLLYLINESMASTLVPRFYGTVLKANNSELIEMANKKILIPKYVEAMGRQDSVRFINIHGMALAKVLRIIHNQRPYGIVTDMTGRIRANGGTAMNDIAQVEYVWNGLREAAATEDFFNCGSAQISFEGKNMWYPPLSALQNSKTGIQTTLDLALWMGNLSPQESPSTANMRGLSTPKNKLVKEGRKSRVAFQTEFKPERNEWI